MLHTGQWCVVYRHFGPSITYCVGNGLGFYGRGTSELLKLRESVSCSSLSPCWTARMTSDSNVDVV